MSGHKAIQRQEAQRWLDIAVEDIEVARASAGLPRAPVWARRPIIFNRPAKKS